jgi:hypothetical protein
VPALDGNAYRKKVLTRLVADFAVADPETGDPFFVFDLPLDSDQETVVAQIGEVVAFWQKERNSVKYKGVAADLVAARPRYEAVLADPVRRSAAVARVRAQRAAADAERFGDLDRLARQLIDRFGGVPTAKVDQLRLVARRGGTDDQVFADWLSRQPILAAGAAPAEPWEPAIRRQIRSQLGELARQSGDPARYATLWTFLDLSPHSPDAALAARHAELLSANQGARHNSAKTRTGELLAQVKTRLMAEGGRDAYAASLKADAADLIYSDVAEKALVTGEVTAADYETLVQRVIALGWGISNDDARTAVRSAATALGASLAVAPATDYLICGECRAPQAAPAPSERAGARCRYCAAALYLTCPNCARLVESAAATCPDCGISFTAHREASALLEQARQELSAGRPLAAQDLLARSRARSEPVTGPAGSAANPAANGAAAVRGPAELAAAIAAARQTAQSEWQALEQDVAAGRIWAAYDRAARLHRTASDLPSPAGVPVDQRRSELATLKAELQTLVRDAVALPPEAAEAALARLLARAVDCPEAIAALAGIPLAAPSGLRVQVSESGVSLQWRPSNAPGPVSYRVVRLAGLPGRTPTPATIGTTSATSLEDAGAPGGTELIYEVSAVAGRRSSEPLVSAPVLMIRDVTAVRAEVSDGQVELIWSGLVGGGAVVIERSTDQAALKRRIRPDEPNRYVDPDVVPGPVYTYRVFVEYRRAGAAPTVTDGRSVSVRMPPRPIAVRDLWARTDADRTVLNFSTPPDGVVRIYAVTDASVLAEPGTVLNPQQLAALNDRARLVGTARRRLIDPVAVGRIRYTPVTVVEDQAVVGAALEHLAVGRVTNLDAVDHGDRVRLTFDLPRGATEAMIRWRFGEPPSGLDDPQAQAAKVTNTKLEISGGFDVVAPDDGRALHVAVYPALRLQSGALTAAGTPATLEARPGRPLQVRYQAQRVGLLRRAVRVDIDAGSETLPLVVLVVRPGDEAPTSPEGGTVLAGAGGDGRCRATLEVPIDQFPVGVSTFRLLLAGPPERPTQVLYPDPADLSVSR